MLISPTARSRAPEVNPLENPQKTPESEPACSSGDTYVHTDQGTLEIPYIDVGSRVLARSDVTGEQSYRRVVNKFVHDERQTYSLDYVTPDGARTPCSLRLNIRFGSKTAAGRRPVVCKAGKCWRYAILTDEMIATVAWGAYRSWPSVAADGRPRWSAWRQLTLLKQCITSRSRSFTSISSVCSGYGFITILEYSLPPRSVIQCHCP